MWSWVATEDLVSDTSLRRSTLELSGLPWQSSSSDSAFTVGAWVRSLVGERKSHTPRTVQPNRKKKKKRLNKTLKLSLSCTSSKNITRVLRTIPASCKPFCLKVSPYYATILDRNQSLLHKHLYFWLAAIVIPDKQLM